MSSEVEVVIPEQVESFTIELEDLKQIVGEAFNISVDDIEIEDYEVQIDVETKEESGKQEEAR